jgi:antitoxin component YwqK of YwqJK toxin-antitoxin module
MRIEGADQLDSDRIGVRAPEVCAMKTQAYWSNGVLREVIDGVLRTEESGRVLRRWHANGAMEKEMTLRDGRPDGLCREWHDNGRLARECYYRDGLLDGVVRQWNRDGRLLGEYQMKLGRGIRREWNADGSLRMECETLAGGGSWVRSWDGDGAPEMTYIWDGEIVSSGRFIEEFSKWCDTL